MSTLDLKKFDMRSIQFPRGRESKGPVIVMIGRRETGKSWLVKDLLYYHRDIPVGTVISGTEEGNGFYKTIVPKLFIHNEYNSFIIENILKCQKKKLKQSNKEFEQYGRTSVDPRAFVILDDVLYDAKWTKDKFMSFIFMNGRHWQIMLIITMQYSMGIPPRFRTNVDYVFILRDNITANRKRLYENYAGMFYTFEAFCAVMDQCTENFECLVIYCNAKSNKLTDQVFWYKAEPHPPFRLGAPEVWELSKQIVDEDDSEEAFDASKFRKKNAGPMVQVRKST